MSLHLVWSPAAEEDLLQIWHYIADQASTARADGQIRKIRSTGQTLRDWPFSGRSREELIPGMRAMVIAPYVIFYRVAQESVEVVRVLHGHRDVDAIFARG